MRVTGIPPRPTGTSPEAYYMQRIWDRCFGDEVQFIDTPTVKVEASTRGIAFHAAPRRGGPGGVTVTRYRLQSVEGNYIVCHTWDGSSEGDEDIYIGKPFKLRTDILTETLDGVVFNYQYTPGNVQRTARSADNTIVEVQVITPRYLVDDEIFAIEASTGLMTVGAEPEAITLLDLNLDARYWLQGN